MWGTNKRERTMERTYPYIGNSDNSQQQQLVCALPGKPCVPHQQSTVTARYSKHLLPCIISMPNNYSFG